jgi:hypothetical protein
VFGQLAANQALPAAQAEVMGISSRSELDESSERVLLPAFASQARLRNVSGWIARRARRARSRAAIRSSGTCAVA